MLRCIVTCAVLAAFGTPRPIPLQEGASSASVEQNSEWENNNVGAERSVEDTVAANPADGRRDYEPSPESDPPFKYPWTGGVGQWSYYLIWGWPLGTYPPVSDDYDYYDEGKGKKKANFDDPEWAEDLLAHQIYGLGYTTPASFRPDMPRKVLMTMLDKQAVCGMFKFKHGRVADFIGRVLADISLNFWLMDAYAETKKTVD